MDEFIREYLRLRDGNKAPIESWLVKHDGGKPEKFELCFRSPMEYVGLGRAKEALLAAASSGAVYANLHFRYEDNKRVFIACDMLLNELFFPLRSKGVIGHAVPPWTTEPKKGVWMVELFPIEVVLEHQRGLLKSAEMLSYMLASLGGVLPSVDRNKLN